MPHSFFVSHRLVPVRSSRTLVPTLFPILTALSLCAIDVPAIANVLPEAIIYFNVQPAPAGDLCETSITSCEQMHRTTPEQGLVGIQVFIDPVYDELQPKPVFRADLMWPPAWTLITYDFCRDGEGTLNPWGANPHALEITWPCTSHPELFLAFWLVFDVQGYGRLEVEESELWTGCPPEGFWLRPNAIWGAEAGATCDYIDQPCQWFHFDCAPGFTQDELTLTTVPGGGAHGEILFTAWQGDWGQYGCHGRFEVQTEAPWCTGSVIDGAVEDENILLIDADATGLDVGTYTSWAQVQTHSHSIARCVDVTLEVQDPISVVKARWGRIKALYR